MLKTPILFLIFNRLDTTQRVFQQIKLAKPERLYIAADGPRINYPDDIVNCKVIKDWVMRSIDWQCQVKTHFKEQNLGCAKAVSESISWFFENEEEGIILEDDTVPNQSFFVFCSELLLKYRENQEVMHISGSTLPVPEKFTDKRSYYFTSYPGIWGWATWKRAWKVYDLTLDNISDFPEKLKHTTHLSRTQRKLWNKSFENIKRNPLYTWDYQWLFTVMYYGLAIRPVHNLTTNIGFRSDATHTKDPTSIFANMPNSEFNEIIHPDILQSNPELDDFLTKVEFGIITTPLLTRIMNKVKIFLKK